MLPEQALKLQELLPEILKQLEYYLDMVDSEWGDGTKRIEDDPLISKLKDIQNGT